MHYVRRESTGKAAMHPATAFHRRWVPTSIMLALGLALLATGLLSHAPQTLQNASAAAVPPQCNGVQNVGGQGIACTVTVDNYVTGAGVATAPSTVTVTTCADAAGPILAGATTSCVTTTTTSAEPVTVIDQCNGSGNGGGGVVICTVAVTNHFSSNPTTPISAATVYQCIPLPPGGSCSPVNTAASVTAATVGQCNNSGAGGTSAGFQCTVFGATGMTATLPVHVEQCNGSGNGGGSFVRCRATVTNQVTATPTATASPTATATASPTVSATPTATASPSPSPTTTPTPPVVEVVVPIVPPTGSTVPEIVYVPVAAETVPAAPPDAIVVPPVLIPPGVSQVVLPPVVVPAGVARVLVPIIAPPGAVPVIVAQVVAPPRPPTTGNAGLEERGATSQSAVVWVVLSMTAIGIALGGRWIGSRRRAQ